MASEPKPGFYIATAEWGPTTVDDLLRDVEHWRKEHDEVCAHLAEYEEKLRAARRDAERYRWLRHNADEIEWRRWHWIGPGTVEVFAQDLDIAIDAEIAREKERADG